LLKAVSEPQAGSCSEMWQKEGFMSIRTPMPDLFLLPISWQYSLFM